jgi:hypothetical protein
MYETDPSHRVVKPYPHKHMQHTHTHISHAPYTRNRARVPLTPGGQIIVGLPSFSIHLEAPLLLGASSPFLLARWSNATEDSPFEKLIITVSASVVNGQTVSFSVPAEAGLILPALGNRKNNPELTLSFGLSSSSVISPIPVQSSPAIGSFGGTVTVTRTAQTQTQAGSNGTSSTRDRLTLSFMPNFKLVSAEMVKFTLPYMSAASTMLQVNGSSAGNFGGRAEWVPAKNELVLRVAASQEINAGHTVSLNVWGLRVLESDVQAATASGGAPTHVLVSCSAKEGTVLPTPVDKVCKIVPGYSKCCRGAVECLL